MAEARALEGLVEQDLLRSVDEVFLTPNTWLMRMSTSSQTITKNRWATRPDGHDPVVDLAVIEAHRSTHQVLELRRALGRGTVP